MTQVPDARDVRPRLHEPVSSGEVVGCDLAATGPGALFACGGGGDVVLLREMFDQASPALTSERPNLRIEACTGRLRGLGSERELVRVTVGSVEG